MMKDQIITLIDKPIDKMTRTDLRREYKVQRFMLRQAKRFKVKFEHQDEQTDKPSTVREDKIEYFTAMERVLEAQCAEIRFFMDRRADEALVPYSKLNPNTRRKRRRDSAERAKKSALDGSIRKNWVRRTTDGINLSWDREKFMLVARDRGYQTEEAVIYAVGQELNLERHIVVLMLKTGRCSWGQVLCLGAMLEMTPKEFCDIFMSGYFVERFGEYVASYENIDKSELLKRSRTRVEIDT